MYINPIEFNQPALLTGEVRAGSLSDLGDFSGGSPGLSQICVYFLVNRWLFIEK